MRILTAFIVFSILGTLSLYSQDKGYIQSAYDAMQAKEYESAIVFYDKAIEAKPDFAPALYGRGLAYAHLGKISESTDDFLEAIENDKSMDQAYYAVGLNYIAEGQYDEAIKMISEAIRLKGDIAHYYYSN